MALVNLTQSQIMGALTRTGSKLGAAQFTFSIPGTSSLWPTYAAGTEPTTGYAIVTAAQAAAFRLALASWDELIAPNFAEVVDDASGRGEVRVAFTTYDMDTGTAAYAYSSVPTAPGGKSGDVWINADSTGESFARGSYNFEVLVHELGHALGLSHSFDTPAVPAPYENARYTVMSYTAAAASVMVTFTARGTGVSASFANAVAVTPMVLDVAAVQGIYGADPTTRSGDTVYRFNQDDPTLQTIYDAGGTDTIDLSNFTRPNTIDLTPGSYSTVGEFSRSAQVAYWTAQFPSSTAFITSTLSRSDLWTHADNLGIAFSTTIENAIGGSAADRITGNAVANVLRGMAGADILIGGDGDDTLDGGADDDVLTGGAGADVYLFADAADGNDRITDFTIADDRFDLAGRSFTALSQSGGNTRLTYAGGTVQLDGVVGLTLAQVNARVIGAAPPPPPPPPPPPLVTAPTVVTAYPGDGTTGVSPVSDIRLVFSGTLARGSGTITLSSGGTVIETFAADSSRLTLSGTVLTIDPTRAFTPGQSYTLSIAAGALTAGGAAVAALANYDFTVAAAPVAVDHFTWIGTAGTGGTVFGTGQVVGDAGTQDVFVADAPGRILFDPSFNAGGDRIHLVGNAADWTVRRSGSSVELSDGDTIVVVPVGLGGADLIFADGIRAIGFDAASASVRIGGQVVTTTALPVAAPAGVATALGAIDAAIQAQLVVTGGAHADALGNALVVGTAAAETVTVRRVGSYTFDPSFNSGGDTIVLPGTSGAFTARVSGSTLVLNGGGAGHVEIPIGLSATTIRFDDGDRALRYDPATQSVVLGDTTIARTDTALVNLPTTAASLDRDNDGNLSTAFTIDASGGNYRFTDSAATAQNVRLTGFGAGDRIVLDGPASDYQFSSSGSDLVIQRFGSDGSVATTTIAGLVDPGFHVNSALSASIAAGIDFLTFAV